MRIEVASIGARGIDSEPYSHMGDRAHADALRAAGYDFVVSYLGAIAPAMLENILSAGLAFMPCTYADRFDDDVVKQLKDLGIPTGATVWLDIEGLAIFNTPPESLSSKVNAWAQRVMQANYIAGAYFGSPQPFTSAELFNLSVTRYWKGFSRVSDRHNALAEPECGWCMTQIFPSVGVAGIWSDVDFIGQDFKRRLPTWVKA